MVYHVTRPLPHQERMAKLWPVPVILFFLLASLFTAGSAAASTARGTSTYVTNFALQATSQQHRGCEPTYDQLASDSLLAARGGGRTLYRAVGPDELADIQAAGRYRVPSGGTEGKYFFETPEQASNFARMMGDQPYTTTSVRVSPSQLGRGQPINPAREGPGYFFNAPDVPSGPVTIFNYSVVP